MIREEKLGQAPIVLVSVATTPALCGVGPPMTISVQSPMALQQQKL
jgi:hypothetical protein